MDNKQIVRRACQEANPVLLQFSFGCEIKAKKDKLYNYWDGKIIGSGIGHSSWYCIVYDDNFSFGKIKSFMEKDMKILGHEPTLADVLLATKKKWRTMYGVPENPLGDVPLREGQMLYYIVSKWSLSLPFNEQSDETFAFLANLLK